MVSRRLLALLVLLFSPSLLAQFGNTEQTGNIRVRVVFENGRRCATQARLVLMTGASTSPVAETFTNDECMAGFDNLTVGTYHLVVTGEGIQETDSGLFEVDSRKTSQFIFVTVKSAKAAGEITSVPGAPTVAALDLNIPEKARKEFDKANDLIAKQDWDKAKEHLQKALAIYPQFADAYNNLAVIYARTGDRAREREALQQAIRLNDHFAPAFVNFGKLEIYDHNFPAAESYLTRAATLEPNNPQTLVLLANVELMNQHFDDAISNCHKVHSMQHGSQSLVHYIAARALEHLNRLREALDEFRTFLVEEPPGPRADAARKEMAALENQVRSQ